MNIEYLFINTYAAFNARDIEAVLAVMHADVDWPNGMEGGRVLGHDEVRKYWTRQWNMIDPTVTPERFVIEEDGRIAVHVHQVVRDLGGNIIFEGMVEIMTQSGLIFISAAMDNFLRAFDLETGQELWKGRLPAGGQATPMTYRNRENGRQFVLIAAGGHGRMGTDIGDSLVAFALPESGAGMLAQTLARTIRIVGVLFVLFLAFFLIFRYAHRNWLWYTLLALLILIATWTAWLVSQTVPVTLLTLFAAVAIAWLLTLGRKRLYAR